IGKQSLLREDRPEHRVMGLRQRTRTKGGSQSFGRLHLFSCYLSQAFEDRRFTKREIPFRYPQSALHTTAVCDAGSADSRLATALFRCGWRELLNDCFEAWISAQRVPERKQLKHAVAGDVGCERKRHGGV